MCLLFNPESRGTVNLASADPTVPPIIDPRFLTSPFDRRIIIEGTRELLRVLSAPVYAANTIERLGPEIKSDEAIWVGTKSCDSFPANNLQEYVRHNLYSSWHMSCTARMGTDSASACVDSSFRVFGLEKLRIVDLSVCPFVPK
jgi:choline dehydrogenase-like flavoprotein